MADPNLLDLARRLWPGDWRLDADGDPTLPVEGGLIHIIVGRLTPWIVTREHAHGHTSLALGDDLALCIEHARRAVGADARIALDLDDEASRRAAEEKAYSDAYGFGEGVPNGGGEPMRPGEHQHRARVSAAWPGFEGESYLPGARLAPQPERYSAGFATGWAWRGRRWLDGHTPPAPIANHGGLGWCWADLGLSPCVCGGANRFRVGSIYLCAECRESAGEVSGG